MFSKINFKIVNYLYIYEAIDMVFSFLPVKNNRANQELIPEALTEIDPGDGPLAPLLIKSLESTYVPIKV